MPRGYTEEELAWLRESYPKVGLRAIEDAFEEEFGYRRSRAALSAKAHKMGLHCKRIDGSSRTGATVKMAWGKEPEKTAWMLEHDKGRIIDTVDAFEREFGIRLAKTQVTLFRQTHGTISRHKCGGRWGDSHPIGSRRDTGKGYALVKVRDRPAVKGSKDNWEMEHVLAYERAYGPVPEGHQVMFCDRDHSNLDPENLMAVPKKLAGIVSQQGMEYRDRSSLRACVNAAKLKSRIVDLELAPRRCEVCGLEFAPKERHQTEIKTCPQCLKAGHKAKGRRVYKRKGEDDGQR